MYMAMPSLAFPLLLFVSAYDLVLNLRKSPKRRLGRNKTVMMRIVIILSVVLFFLYPTLMNTINGMHKCTTIVLDDDPQTGMKHQIRILNQDYSSRCDTPEHLHLQNLTWIFLGVYGLGTPVGILLYGMYLRRRNREVELNVLAFYFVGFRPKVRYWESVNMVRKLITALIMTHVVDVRLKIYCLMWLLSVALILQEKFQPASNPFLHRVDIHFLVTMIVTLNLNLLWATESIEEYFANGSPQTLGLIIVIFVLHGCLWLHFATLVFKAPPPRSIPPTIQTPPLPPTLSIPSAPEASKGR